jgi:hypothetical protein
MIYIAVVFLALQLFFHQANATSFGSMEAADIASIDDKPAICLPGDVKEAFSVGWVTLSESNVRNASGWGIALKSGAKPLLLNPGACLVFGDLPEGYELYKLKNPYLKLEVNKTYVFAINDAIRPTYSYRVIFFVCESENGILTYLKYARDNEGREVVPSCGF